MTDDRSPFDSDPSQWPTTPPPWNAAPTPPPAPPMAPPVAPPVAPPAAPGWSWDNGAGGTGQYWWANPAQPPPGMPQPAPAPAPHSSRKRNILAFVGGLTVASLLIGAGALVRQGFDNASHSTQAQAPAITPSTNSGGTGGSSSSGSNGFGFGNGSGSGSETPATTPQVSQSAQAIANKVDDAVVDIDTKLSYQQAAAAGTGMVLTANGQVLTNNHVVDGATSITATVVSTGKTYTAHVVGTDATDDVAVIQLEGASGLSTIETADSSKVATGDQVVAIGNAGGTGGTPSVVTGSVTDTNQSITASDEGGADAEQLSGLIQTDAPIVAGDSGGPLANGQGQVIGMDTAASSQNQFASQSSVGFAIPINHALSIAKQIQAGQSSTKIHIGETAFLGVELAPDTSSTAGNGSGSGSGYGSGSGTGYGSGSSSSSSTSGVVIQGVVSGSPADKVGMTAGDTVTAFGGKSVDSQKTLSSLTQAHHPGDRVSVSWTDSSGQSHTATVTLVVGPTG